MKSYLVILQFEVKCIIILLIHAFMDIEGFPLARVIEGRMIFVLVDIALLSNEGMVLLEVIRRFLANSIGLSWEGLDANIIVECPTSHDEFKNMSLLHSKNGSLIKLK